MAQAGRRPAAVDASVPRPPARDNPWLQAHNLEVVDSNPPPIRTCDGRGTALVPTATSYVSKASSRGDDGNAGTLRDDLRDPPAGWGRRGRVPPVSPISPDVQRFGAATRWRPSGGYSHYVLHATMARYRRAGADPLFRDPARDHGAPFEGYYWRFTDAVRRRVVVALCGLSTHPGTRSALVGLAVHPEGVVRSAILPEVRGDAGRFGVSAGDALDASPAAVRVAPTPGDWVEVTIEDARPWPRDLLGGSGVAQLIPGLPQYWHPHLIGGRVRGTLTVGGERTTLDGATV